MKRSFGIILFLCFLFVVLPTSAQSELSYEEYFSVVREPGTSKDVEPKAINPSWSGFKLFEEGFGVNLEGEPQTKKILLAGTFHACVPFENDFLLAEAETGRVLRLDLKTRKAEEFLTLPGEVWSMRAYPPLLFFACGSQGRTVYRYYLPTKTLEKVFTLPEGCHIWWAMTNVHLVYTVRNPEFYELAALPQAARDPKTGRLLYPKEFREVLNERFPDRELIYDPTTVLDETDLVAVLASVGVEEFPAHVYDLTTQTEVFDKFEDLIGQPVRANPHTSDGGTAALCGLTAAAAVAAAGCVAGLGLRRKKK